MITLLEERRAQMAALCRSAGVRRLDVFGSAVRDDFNPSTSDLDFVVEFDAKRPTEYADAYFALKEGLETMFGRQVDLVAEKSLVNPYFRDRIASQRQTVYAR